MTVKIRKQLNEFGMSYLGTIYLPDNTYLTKQDKEKAENLDRELQRMVENINTEYISFSNSENKNVTQKWYWLGKKIDGLIKNIAYIDESDIDSNAIWPAIGQYLRPELQRGDDEKRSGTPKDHYRKCWLFATVDNTEWIKSWSSWDALADRGNQLVKNANLMKGLKVRFSTISPKMSTKDFQLLGKIMTKYFPSHGNRPVQLGAMDDSEMDKILDEIYRDFIEEKKKK